MEMSARRLDALKEKHVAAKHMVFHCTREDEEEAKEEMGMHIKEESITFDSNTNREAQMEDVEMRDSDPA
jgi:hypothetical protein